MRKSNFELLRILCMSGILVGHVLITLYQEQIHSIDYSVTNQCRAFLLNACAVGMNCFVMISGYFTIRLTKEKLIKFIGQCWWYGIIGLLVFGGSWMRVLFPVTGSGLRFVNSYLALILVSPLVNAGLGALYGKDLKRAVGLLMVCDIYMGYEHQQAVISADDHSLFHLICMYCLGYWVAQTKWNLRYGCLWCIACFVLMTVLHAIKMVWFPISAIYSLHFNSPLLVIATLLVFLWAKDLKMPQSRVVNWIAASVFSVYLIHCNPSIAPHFWSMMEQVRIIYSSPIMTAIVLVLVTILFFTGCILVDKVRIWVFDLIQNKI